MHYTIIMNEDQKDIFGIIAEYNKIRQNLPEIGLTVDGDVPREREPGIWDIDEYDQRQSLSEQGDQEPISITLSFEVKIEDGARFHFYIFDADERYSRLWVRFNEMVCEPKNNCIKQTLTEMYNRLLDASTNYIVIKGRNKLEKKRHAKP